MKRKIIGLVATAALSTGAFASTNIQLGASSNNLGAGISNKTGIYLGVDGTKDVKKGLLLGVGFNINEFSLDRTQTSGGYTLTTSGAAYIMAVDALVGYTFKDSFNIPLTLKAGVGYGVTHDNIINNNAWNAQYNVSAAYTVYKGFGLGVRYNTTDTQLLNTNVTIDSTIGYLNIEFK